MEDNRKYSVYKHTTPNNKVYIGMTCQKPEKRWNYGKSYKENKYFNNAINKYGWKNIRHEILATNLTKEEAEELEIYFINKKYKSNNMKYGYNIEYGGCHNGKTSEITRKRISEANKGKHNSPKTEFKKGHITIITEEIKQKISEKNKGKHASVRTEFKKGHKPLNARKVLCIESDVVYDTIKKASEDTNVMACHISQVCNGKRKSAGKLHWKFIEN